MKEGMALRLAGARARRLMARLLRPHQGGSLTRPADGWLDPLAPRFAALEVAPFGLPLPELQAATPSPAGSGPAPAAVPLAPRLPALRSGRTVPAVPAQRGASKRDVLPAVTDSASLVRGAVLPLTTTARRAADRIVLPAAEATAGALAAMPAAAAGNAAAPRPRSLAEGPGGTSAVPLEVRATRPPASPDGSLPVEPLAVPAYVTLGALAAGALASPASRGAPGTLPSSTSPAAAGPGPAGGHASPRQNAASGTAPLAAAPALFPLAPLSRGRGDAAAPHVAAAGAPAPPTPSASAATDVRPTGFVFDPLAPRASEGVAADDLAERIGEVLRAQARRQGVDLT